MFDYTLSGASGMTAVEMSNPGTSEHSLRYAMLNLDPPLVWASIGSFLLSATGTTLGKSLFNIRLIPSQGSDLFFQLRWREAGTCGGAALALDFLISL